MLFRSNNSNLLDIDLLEFKELDKNELDEDELQFGLLDVNPLDVDLLLNILDQLVTALDKRKRDDKFADGRKSGFNPVTQVNTLVDGNLTRIIRYFGNSTIDLTLNNDYGYDIKLTQGGIPVNAFSTSDDIDNNLVIYQSE